MKWVGGESLTTVGSNVQQQHITSSPPESSHFFCCCLWCDLKNLLQIFLTESLKFPAECETGSMIGPRHVVRTLWFTEEDQRRWRPHRKCRLVPASIKIWAAQTGVHHKYQRRRRQQPAACTWSPSEPWKPSALKAQDRLDRRDKTRHQNLQRPKQNRQHVSSMELSQNDGTKTKWFLIKGLRHLSEQVFVVQYRTAQRAIRQPGVDNIK